MSDSTTDGNNAPVPATEGSQITTNVVPDEKKGNTPPRTFVQEEVDDIVEGRLAYEKKTLLKRALEEVGVADKAALTTMVAAHNDAETKRLATEESNKSELQKAMDANTALQAQIDTANVNTKNLQIQNAIMLEAPNHNVPSDRFNDLIQLMDMSLIEFDDNGNAKNESVKSAIEKTLETRDYLTTVISTEDDKAPKPGGNGSPVKGRRHPYDAAGKDGKTTEPVVRINHKASM